MAPFCYNGRHSMRVLSAHLLFRVLAIALVLWVNVDVGFCSACASDTVAATSSGPALGPGRAPHDAGPGQLPHPTHCFYHAHWVELPSSVMLANPAGRSGPVAETPARAPEILTHAFDHPPRLAS
jgi:hypothetical protein